MSKDVLPAIERIYLTLEAGPPGRVLLRLMKIRPTATSIAAALISRGQIMSGQTDMALQLVSDPSADPTLRGTNGKDATTLLGTVTIAETATVVAINAGMRRVTITTPTAWGVAKGQDFALCADALPSNAYALHDAVAIAPNTLSVGLTTPLIALLSSYTITARLRRFN